MAARTPLHPIHERLGAVLAETDGWLLPLHYGDPAGEHRAVRSAAGLLDRSHRGKLEATGRDRVGFLQGMLTNDVKVLGPGQGCWAALLDAHGKVVSLLVVHALEDRLVLELDPGLTAKTLEALERHLISERVEFRDAGGEWGILGCHGPEARPVVEAFLGRALPPLAPWHHAPLGLDSTAGRVVRAEVTGEEGYDLWLPPERLAEAWGRLVALGARPVGQEALNALRVEAGIPWYGADVDEGTLAIEAPLEAAISYTKGCYIGQEIVARVTYRGHVNRKLVGFVLQEGALPRRGDRVVVAGKEVGAITSAVASPTLGRPIALGYLRREHWEPGTRVEIHAEGRSLGAEVAALPFYRRDNSEGGSAPLPTALGKADPSAFADGLRGLPPPNIKT